MEETGVPRENHWPAASHWQMLSHNVVTSIPRLSGIWTHNVSQSLGVWSLSRRGIQGKLVHVKTRGDFCIHYMAIWAFSYPRLSNHNSPATKYGWYKRDNHVSFPCINWLQKTNGIYVSSNQNHTFFPSNHPMCLHVFITRDYQVRLS